MGFIIVRKPGSDYSLGPESASKGPDTGAVHPRFAGQGFPADSGARPRFPRWPRLAPPSGRWIRKRPPTSGAETRHYDPNPVHARTHGPSTLRAMALVSLDSLGEPSYNPK